MKAGIVGTGFIGQEHLNAMLACGITEICLCDRDAEQAQKMVALCDGRAHTHVYTDYDEMLNEADLNFVSVCTPTSSHGHLTIKALEKGIPVLCEKPFATTADEAARMVAKAEETGTLLMVAHCLRFAKTYAYLKKCVEDGRFGKLLTLTMYRHSTAPLWSAENWLMNCEKSGGAVVDLHIHETDMVEFLLGAPQAVTTVGSYKQCATVYHYDDSEAAVSAQSSWRPTRTYPFTSGFDAGFEGAAIQCRGNEMQVYTDDGVLEDALGKETFPSYITDESPYVCEMRYFLECLPFGKAPFCDPKDSMMSLKVAHAELASVLEKKTVCIK